MLYSLDEAIKHCEQKSCSNDECSKEHQQLANWLKELKAYKEKYENIMSEYVLIENVIGKFHIAKHVDGKWKCICATYQHELEGFYSTPLKVYSFDKEYIGRDRDSGKFFHIVRISAPMCNPTDAHSYIWDCIANIRFVDNFGYGHTAGKTDIFYEDEVNVDGRWMYDNRGRLLKD